MGSEAEGLGRGKGPGEGASRRRGEEKAWDTESEAPVDGCLLRSGNIGRKEVDQYIYLRKVGSYRCAATKVHNLQAVDVSLSLHSRMPIHPWYAIQLTPQPTCQLSCVDRGRRMTTWPPLGGPCLTSKTCRPYLRDSLLLPTIARASRR